MHTPPLLAVWLGASLLLTPIAAFADEIPVTPSTSTQETISSASSANTSTISTVQPQTTTTDPPPTESTSTVALTPPQIASSTPPTIGTNSTTSVETVPPLTTPSTSTSVITTPSVPVVSANPTEATSTLCLGIISPAPTQGYEWVAFYGLTPSTTNALIGWSLFDAQGSLLKFTTSTTLLWDETSKTMRIELHSSRLNNDGDSVILKNPATDPFDQFTYTKTNHDQRWMRDSCTAPWHIFPLPAPPSTPTPAITPTPTQNTTSTTTQETPTTTTETVTSTSTSTVATIDPDPVMTIQSVSLPEIIPPEEPVADQTPTTESTPPVSDTYPEPNSVTVTFIKPPTSTIAEPIKIAETAVSAASTQAKSIPAKKASAQKSKKSSTKIVSDTPSPTTPPPPKKKTSAKTTKKTSNPSFIPLSMTDVLDHPETRQGIRVRLSGRVASAQGIVGAQKYVIVNEDGRGLLVVATTKQPTPPIGTRIDLTGTIVWNDAGVSLKQSTTDRWSTNALVTATTTNPESLIPTRIVDLVAPSQEDAWSFITVEGKVSATHTSSFEIDVGDTSIRVLVRSRIGYRVQRLSAGDTVSVRGLLDTRTDSPAILPQSAEAIQILTRAPLKNVGTPAPAPVNQPWLPVGAAAGTFAVSEGWRRIHAWRKQREEAAAFKALRQKTGQEIA